MWPMMIFNFGKPVEDTGDYQAQTMHARLHMPAPASG